MQSFVGGKERKREREREREARRDSVPTRTDASLKAHNEARMRGHAETIAPCTKPTES